MIKEINESNFQDEIKDGIVLLDLFTTTCGPCRMQANILEQCTSFVKIVKLDIFEAMDVSSRLGVRSVPTLVFYKNGTEVRRFVDVQQESVIRKTVDELSETD